MKHLIKVIFYIIIVTLFTIELKAQYIVVNQREGSIFLAEYENNRVKMQKNNEPSSENENCSNIFSNKEQLTIAYTTFNGKNELINREGSLDNETLAKRAINKQSTSIEARDFIIEQAKEYGYKDRGGSFMIADSKEVHILEIIGKGEANDGIIWISVPLPSNHIYVNTGTATITKFIENNNNNGMEHCRDIISFAVESGYFLGKNVDFNFAENYTSPDSTKKKYHNELYKEIKSVILKELGLIESPNNYSAVNTPVRSIGIGRKEVKIDQIRVVLENLSPKENNQYGAFIVEKRDHLPKVLKTVQWHGIGFNDIILFSPIYLNISDYKIYLNRESPSLNYINQSGFKEAADNKEEKYKTLIPVIDKSAKLLIKDDNHFEAKLLLSEFTKGQLLIVADLIERLKEEEKSYNKDN
ncbi:C69 family dipeptidase [Marinilabiliaceae bacterium ANBcel2]|nr:C69 family dipeptidase [Marinilabiliaceae bacterium ANBcel2]